ncbi:hypothetical protein QJS04_geneDACA000808 [Acorus gramineus]|uniref:Uncharacterized protein n=1 Tax=Acorus gramineus TaxID=55184 RepID=A0AAV9BI59_ACOGR|nr:hypothetical protein QJS04_geneDACA000808 [Acorus gramineus]
MRQIRNVSGAAAEDAERAIQMKNTSVIGEDAIVNKKANDASAENKLEQSSGVQESGSAELSKGILNKTTLCNVQADNGQGSEKQRQAIHSNSHHDGDNQ